MRAAVTRRALVQQFARRLIACRDGLAMIEFAMTLPVFVLLMLGGLEVANLALTHARINQIAMTVADNAGRVRTGIDEANIYEVFAGADLVGRAIDFKENGRIVLSSLEPNGRTGSTAGQMINWQRCHGDLTVVPSYGRQGKGRTDASLRTGMGEPGTRIVAPSGTAVMFVEVTYRYRPTFFAGIGPASRDLRYESAFNVRERTNNNISNTQNLALNAC